MFLLTSQNDRSKMDISSLSFTEMSLKVGSIHLLHLDGSIYGQFLINNQEFAKIVSNMVECFKLFGNVAWERGTVVMFIYLEKSSSNMCSEQTNHMTGTKQF